MITIENGWCFSTADFSIRASGRPNANGRVVLIRDPSQKKIWHEIINELDADGDEWPPLNVQGEGLTIEDAIENANRMAREVGLLSSDG